MRIGIDGRLLSVRHTGISVYTLELLRRLQHYDVDYFIYMPSEPVEVERWSGQITFRYSSCRSRLGRFLWAQALLPKLAISDRLDIFWGPAHRVPHQLPRRTAKVVSIHDLTWKLHPGTMRLTGFINEWLQVPSVLRNCDRVVVDSESTFSDLIKFFPSVEEKTTVVPLGIPFLTQPEPRLSLLRFNIDRPYFLFVGTLEPRKNLRRLLLAYSLLPRAVREQNLFVVVGGSGWGPSIKRYAASLGINEQVIFLGYIDRGVLATFYANAKFLAMPSIYEGFGLPIVEAMSLGLPVLASGVSSMPEVVGEAGLLVNPMDHNEISRAILRMLTDGELLCRLSFLAKKQARLFSWEKAASAIMDIFVEAVAFRRRVSLG